MQAECAQATLQAGACCCCEAALQKQSFSSTKLDASPTKAMRLLMAQEPETVMQTASAAIEFLSYQKSLGVAKRRKTDKAKVKNILDQSRKRIVELHDGYKKVRPHPNLGATLQAKSSRCMQSGQSGRFRCMLSGTLSVRNTARTCP